MIITNAQADLIDWYYMYLTLNTVASHSLGWNDVCDELVKEGIFYPYHKSKYSDSSATLTFKGLWYAYLLQLDKLP